MQSFLLKRNGRLHEIRRMEVHEHAVPIIGHKGHTAHRLSFENYKRISTYYADEA